MPAAKNPTCEIVAIGASWGGLQALSVLLAALPAKFHFPVVVVQHRGAESDAGMLNYLQQFCPAPLHECDDKERLLPGHVYFAPPGYHLAVARGQASLSMDPPVNSAQPSIDVLLDSVGREYRHGAVGIVLTGAGTDGAAGLRVLRELGGLAVVQDPETAEMPSMPRAAIEAASPQRVLPLPAIAELLSGLAAATPPEKQQQRQR